MFATCVYQNYFLCLRLCIHRKVQRLGLFTCFFFLLCCLPGCQWGWFVGSLSDALHSSVSWSGTQNYPGKDLLQTYLPCSLFGQGQYLVLQHTGVCFIIQSLWVSPSFCLSTLKFQHSPSATHLVNSCSPLVLILSYGEEVSAGCLYSTILDLCLTEILKMTRFSVRNQ